MGDPNDGDEYVIGPDGQGSSDEWKLSPNVHFDMDAGVLTIRDLPETVRDGFALYMDGKRIWSCSAKVPPFDEPGKSEESARTYEQMVRFEVGKLVIRGWLQLDIEQEDQIDLLHATQFKDCVRKALAESKGIVRAAAKTVADSLPFLNAVEFLAPNGSGVLAYPTWP